MEVKGKTEELNRRIARDRLTAPGAFPILGTCLEPHKNYNGFVRDSSKDTKYLEPGLPLGSTLGTPWLPENLSRHYATEDWLDGLHLQGFRPVQNDYYEKL